MAFFDELSKKAQAYAGVAVEKARDLADTASEKARAAADSAKISMAISTEQREMEKNYRAIGEWFVSEYEGEIPDAVKDVVDLEPIGLLGRSPLAQHILAQHGPRRLLEAFARKQTVVALEVELGPAASPRYACTGRM